MSVIVPKKFLLDLFWRRASLNFTGQIINQTNAVLPVVPLQMPPSQ